MREISAVFFIKPATITVIVFTGKWQRIKWSLNVFYAAS